jgi:hypothetical protein
MLRGCTRGWFSPLAHSETERPANQRACTASSPAKSATQICNRRFTASAGSELYFRYRRHDVHLLRGPPGPLPGAAFFVAGGSRTPRRVFPVSPDSWFRDGRIIGQVRRSDLSRKESSRSSGPVLCEFLDRQNLDNSCPEIHPAAGKVTVKVEPLPGVLWMSSRPRWRLTTCFTMARPRPVPPSWRERAVSTR